MKKAVAMTLTLAMLACSFSACTKAQDSQTSNSAVFIFKI